MNTIRKTVGFGKLCAAGCNNCLLPVHNSRGIIKAESRGPVETAKAFPTRQRIPIIPYYTKEESKWQYLLRAAADILAVIRRLRWKGREGNRDSGQLLQFQAGGPPPHQGAGGKDILFYECDIRDADGLRRVFREHEYRRRYSFAGLKAVGESVQKPLEYYENNVGGTVTLCQVMAEFGCKRMVYSAPPPRCTA